MWLFSTCWREVKVKILPPAFRQSAVGSGQWQLAVVLASLDPSSAVLPALPELPATFAQFLPGPKTKDAGRSVPSCDMLSLQSGEPTKKRSDNETENGIYR